MRSADPRLLLIDDDDILRRVVSRVLQARYPRVFAASNNADALEIIELERPDVVISDQNRPGGTGLDLVRTLREVEDTRHLPIIILSGGTSRDTELELRRAGVAAFFTKPVSVETLVAAVDTALGRDSDPDVVLIELGVETRDLDYKLSLEFSSRKAVADVARDVIAMANSGGGTIVFGVSEPSPGEFRPLGLTREEAGRYETTRMGDALRRYVGADVQISCRLAALRGRVYPILKIGGIVDSIALAASQHQEASLFMGRVYVRTEDARTTELQDPTHLRRIIDRLVEQRVQRMLGTSRPVRG